MFERRAEDVAHRDFVSEELRIDTYQVEEDSFLHRRDNCFLETDCLGPRRLSDDRR